MYIIRPAVSADLTAILQLYKKVAVLKTGIARNVTEVTPAYIQHFMTEAAKTGIELVALHPDRAGEIIAEIHCYTWGIAKFSHVMSELTIAVAPDFQGQGVGKAIFIQLLGMVEQSRPDILRVELGVQESNQRAIAFYKKIGFIEEGRFEQRVQLEDGILEADILMVWFNKQYRK
jgi:ribosomal protein S18 acetylase RimI-like enzyme